MKTSILNLSDHFYFKACHLYCPNLNCTNLVAEMASVFYIDLAFENCFGTIIEILQLGTLSLYFEQGFPHLAYLSCCIYMNLHLKVGHSRYLIAHHLNLIGNYLLIGNLYSTLYRSLMSLFSQGAARASIYSGDPFDCLQFFSYHILQDYLNFFLFQLSEIANLNLIRNYFLLFKVMAVLSHYYQNIIIFLKNLNLLLSLFIFLLVLSMLIPYLFIVMH